VIVKSDSELMVRQINGIYRVKKEELKPLHQDVKRLSCSFESCIVINIPREENREADKLANLALDTGLI
jgi:ribonuclease HI